MKEGGEIKNTNKYKYTSTVIIILISFIAYPLLVMFLSYPDLESGFAWSFAWGWSSQVEPLDILPILFIFSVIAEALMINFILKLKSLFKVFCIVTFGNLLSFLTPYLKICFIWLEETILTGGASFDLWEGLDNGYTCGLPFFAVTVLIEISVICIYLASQNKKEQYGLLVGVVLGANVLTSVIISSVEWTLCYGQYQW